MPFVERAGRPALQAGGAEGGLRTTTLVGPGGVTALNSTALSHSALQDAEFELESVRHKKEVIMRSVGKTRKSLYAPPFVLKVARWNSEVVLGSTGLFQVDEKSQLMGTMGTLS